MACSTMKISAFMPSMMAKDSVFEGRGLRRSASEPLLRWPKAPPFGGAKLRSSRSAAVLSSARIVVKRSPDEPEGRRVVEAGDDDAEEEERLDLGGRGGRGNWVGRVLELRRQWKGRKGNAGEEVDGYCEVSYDDDDNGGGGDGLEFDDGSFERFLREVDWNQAKIFSKMAFLCNSAYTITDIKAELLKEYYGLELVTSSLEKKMAVDAIKERIKIDRDSSCVPKSGVPPDKQKVRPSVAYQIAASAAAYVHSRAKGLLSPCNGQHDKSCMGYRPEVAACMAASTMTTVVAVEEKAKQEAAMDLRSPGTSPCEWFVCDELSTCTRIFVIQGSDSLVSWQANLMFEPTNFEGRDTLVHRGIYEASKGMYEQFMPEIRNHLRRWGTRARFQFTGHSLGGSLSLLVNLMLLARGDIPQSMLLPVVTFGSPFVFCGGRQVLEELRLDEGCIWSVMMHRDIVPRAFACTYPNHVSQILRKLNGTFRSHPCLNADKLLYSPLGKLFILQPDENFSPPHPFLPSGTGLYALDAGGMPRFKLIAAVKAFLNSPHPLEMLSDPKAYGSKGTIVRDHDSRNYVKAMNCVLRKCSKAMMRRSRIQRFLHLWPLLAAPVSDQPCLCHQQRQLYWHGQELDRCGELVAEEIMSGAWSSSSQHVKVKLEK